MAYNPPVEEVKRYSEENGVKLFEALRELRKAHKHTYADNTMRLANCKRGHSAVYQRCCDVCGTWFCKQCQNS